MILDQEAYYSSQSPSTGATAPESGGDGKTQQSTKPPKKYVVRASGMVEGDVDTYNANSYSVYCNLETLKSMLKKSSAAERFRDSRLQNPENHIRILYIPH